MTIGARRLLTYLLSIAIPLLPASAYASETSRDTPRQATTPSGHAAASGSTSKTLWVGDNAFGHASIWVEHAAAGESTTHFHFTGPDGATVEASKNHEGARLLLPNGEMRLTRLTNGSFSMHLFTNKGCDGAGPDEATIILNSAGEPVGDVAHAKAVQYALGCASADTAREIGSFAALAGLSLPQQASASRARAEGLFGCILAVTCLVLAFVAWAAEPLDPLAYWAFCLSYASAEEDCAD